MLQHDVIQQPEYLDLFKVFWLFCVLFELLTQMYTFSNDLKCCINISCQMTNGCVNMKITYNKTTNA